MSAMSQKQYQCRFMAINAAHEILSDPEERQNYDDGRHHPNSHGGQYQRYHSQQGFRSQEELFRQVAMNSTSLLSMYKYV